MWHIEPFSETARRQLTSEDQIKMQINIVRGVLDDWLVNGMDNSFNV